MRAKEANWLSHVLGVSANQYRMSNGRSLRHEPRAPELPFEVARDVFEEDDLTHKILPALRKVKTRRDVLSDFKGSLPEGQEPPPLAAVHGELRKTFVDFATQNVALVRRFCSSRSEALCFVNRMESQRVSTSLRFWATPERYVRQAKDCDLFGWHVDCKIGEREQVTVCFVVWDGDYAGRRGGDVQYWTRGLASFEQSRFRCEPDRGPPSGCAATLSMGQHASSVYAFCGTAVPHTVTAPYFRLQGREWAVRTFTSA